MKEVGRWREGDEGSGDVERLNKNNSGQNLRKKEGKALIHKDEVRKAKKG